MRRFRYLAGFAFGLLLLAASCKEEPSVESEWPLLNEKAFKSYYNDPAYTKLGDLAKLSDTLVYKVLETGTGRRVLFSDTVNVVYTGWLVNDSIFDTTHDSPFMNIGRSFGIAEGVIPGWRTALQHMSVGDRWELVVPYPLAYGEAGSQSILPYSTLKFDMKVISIKGE